MQRIGLKSLTLLLAAGLLLVAVALPSAAAQGQSFNIYGHAQLFLHDGRIAKITTPFIGTMHIDPNYVDPSLGIVGRVLAVSIRFPLVPEAAAFDVILTQGPEISGVTPLKYDVTLVNADGQQAQLQFTTPDSPATFPGFGTPMGSLVNFRRGRFLQGRTGPLDIDDESTPVFLQNFRGQIGPERR